MRQFLVHGLENGEKCIYISSSRPPQDLLSSVGFQYSDNLIIVDCYTNRITEVPSIVQKGNVVTTPVELSVVKVAISRVADRSPDVPKRAIVDILPTYLIFSNVERMYLDLLEIIDDLKKWGYTPIFSLNPYVIDDEKKILALEEMFDSVLHLERIPESGTSISRKAMLISVGKMARTSLPSKNLQVAIPSEEEPRFNIHQRSAAKIEEGIAS